MGEPVEMSAPRADPAAGFWICTFGMRHLIYDAAFDATSRFAADKFFFLYDLHKILSIEKLPIIAGFSAAPAPNSTPLRSPVLGKLNLIQSFRHCVELVKFRRQILVGLITRI